MSAPRIAAVVLAGGSSTRMEGRHKLLELVDGRAIVRWAVEAAVESGASPVVVVTGHRADEVEAVLPAAVQVERNPDHPAGLSSSLRVGLGALPDETEAATVALGDMPLVRAGHYQALRRAWRPDSIVVPTHMGRRGNPVLWSYRFFPEMSALAGDRGAKSLLARHASSVIEVPIGDDAVLRDVDVADDLERVRRPG